MAQVKAIFWPVKKKRSRNSAHLQYPLLYVEFFKPGKRALGEQDDGCKIHVPDDYIELYRVQRHIENGTRKGAVLPISAIVRPVQLIPNFGDECNTDWDVRETMEYSDSFWVNSFDTLQTYIDIY